MCKRQRDGGEVRQELLGIGKEAKRFRGAKGVEMDDGVVVDEVWLNEIGKAVEEGDSASVGVGCVARLLVMR